MSCRGEEFLNKMMMMMMMIIDGDDGDYFSTIDQIAREINQSL